MTADQLTAIEAGGEAGQGDPGNSHQLYAFVQGFSTAVAAGCSLVRALSSLAADTADPTWKTAIEQVRAEIEGGSTLARALSDLPTLFPSTLVAMVRAGEVGGVLEKTLSRYARWLAKERQLGRSLSSEPRAYCAELSLWCYRFGVLLQSGVPILQALELDAEPPVGDRLQDATLLLREGIREGATMSAKMREWPDVFPAMVVQLFSIGEQTGMLDEISLRVSEYLEQLDDSGVLVGSGEPAGINGPVQERPSRGEPAAKDAPRALAGQVIDGLLADALRAGASDVHLQPEGDTIRVRFRVDGVLRTVSHLESDESTRLLLARLKLRSGIGTARRDSPQKGCLVYGDDQGCEHHVRVITYPLDGAMGEGLSLRIHPGERAFNTLVETGMTPVQREACLKMLAAPCGIVVVTGGRGQGKTTTLHVMVREMLSRGVGTASSIVVLEQPSEFRIDGVTQIALGGNACAGYVEALDGVMRQDPDVLVVGDANSPEVMRAAIGAAETGHLVICGVTAADTAGATRILLGSDEGQAASQLVGLVFQRLVGKCCESCQGKGCADCGGVGTVGRTAVFTLGV